MRRLVWLNLVLELRSLADCSGSWLLVVVGGGGDDGGDGGGVGVGGAAAALGNKYIDEVLGVMYGFPMSNNGYK